MSLVFQQLEDPETNTYTYLVGDSDTGECALVDSVREQFEFYKDLIEKNGWKLCYLIETHVHADHVTANALLKAQYPGVKIVLSSQTAATCDALHLQDGAVLHIGKIPVVCLHTPGHTPDSVSLLVDGNRLLSGDCLLINSCGRTDFQAGNSAHQFQSLKKLAALPGDTLVYPGHDYTGRYVSNIHEQRLHNLQMKHTSEEDFIADLASWKLPPPRKIKESVPRNLTCGG